MKRYQKPVAEIIEVVVAEEIMATESSGSVIPNPGWDLE